MSKSTTATVKTTATTTFILARVLEKMGMAENTAKGFATRKCRELGIPKEENGEVSFTGIRRVLSSYAGSKTSKYAEAGAKLLKELEKTETIKGISNEPAPTKSKESPFIAGKVLAIVKEKFAENKELIALIESETTKLNELALA